jgi:hypothetical protein
MKYIFFYYSVSTKILQVVFNSRRLFLKFLYRGRRTAFCLTVAGRGLTLSQQAVCSTVSRRQRSNSRRLFLRFLCRGRSTAFCLTATGCSAVSRRQRSDPFSAGRPVSKQPQAVPLSTTGRGLTLSQQATGCSAVNHSRRSDPLAGRRLFRRQPQPEV